MDENNDEITDSTDARFEFEVRQEAMQLQRIQAEINAMLVDARLHAGSTNVLDQARAVQIERTLQSLRNERTLVEQANLGPDYRSISAWGSGGLFGAAASSSSASSTQPILPAGATSGGGLFGAALPVAGIDWNWRPSWLQTARPAQPIAGIDFATDLNRRQPRVMPSDSTTDPVEEVD